MTSMTERSPFASALARLLDETNLFDRREWAEVLGVSEPAISQWVQDKTIPRPENLFMILATLERSTDIPEGPLTAFNEIARRVATEVSPNGARMLPTVREYVERPDFSELSSKLARLAPDEQERLLIERYETSAPDEAPAPPNRRRAAAPGRTKRRAAPPRPDARTLRDAVPAVSCRYSGSSPYCGFDEDTPTENVLAPAFRALAENGTLGASLEWVQLAGHRVVVVVGDPGAGKTTFLRLLAEGARGLPSFDFPASERVAYLHLGCLAEGVAPDVDDHAFVAALTRTAGEPVSLLLLDAFDEVPVDLRGRIARAVLRFAEGSAETRAVVTSRPTPDLEAFAECLRCQIESPTDSRLAFWAYKTLAAERPALGAGASALGFLSSLKEHPEILRELRTPLLLKHLASQYALHAATAFDDAGLLDGYLTLLLSTRAERKHERRACRWATALELRKKLSSLCYNAFRAGADEFAAVDAEPWVCGSYGDKTPADEILRVLAESTGIIQSARAGWWRFTQPTLQEYLAARFVIESTVDAELLVSGALDRPRVMSVLKFACGAAPDASGLLRFVLTTEWPRPEDQIATLSEAVAQHLAADRELIGRSCDVIVRWLDVSVAEWEISTMDYDGLDPAPRWGLAARMPTGGVESATWRTLIRSLKALHRARLGPAKPLLRERLGAARSEVTRALGPFLEVDGYLHTRVPPQTESDMFVAQVLAG